MTSSGFLRGENIREHQKWYKCYTRFSTSRYRKLPSSPTTSLSIMARYLIGKRFFKRRQDWDFLLRRIWRRQRDWRHQWRAWWGCWWFDSFLVRVLSMPRWGNGYFHSTIQFFNNIYLYTVVTLWWYFVKYRMMYELHVENWCLQIVSLDWLFLLFPIMCRYVPGICSMCLVEKYMRCKITFR